MKKQRGVSSGIWTNDFLMYLGGLLVVFRIPALTEEYFRLIFPKFMELSDLTKKKRFLTGNGSVINPLSQEEFFVSLTNNPTQLEIASLAGNGHQTLDFHQMSILFLVPDIQKQGKISKSVAFKQALQFFIWLWSAYQHIGFNVSIDSEDMAIVKEMLGKQFVKFLDQYAWWKKYRACADDKARQKMYQAGLTRYLPLVRNVAGRMAINFPRSVELHDLINTGVIGMMEAFRNFDPDRGVKFETHAVSRIRGAILDELRSLDWAPRSTRAKAREIDRALQGFENDFGRQANDEELADMLGMTVKDLYWWLEDVSKTTLLSLDEMIFREEDNRQVSRIETVSLEGAEKTDDMTERNQRYHFLFQYIDRLTEQEKLVLRLYYFEELTLKEIGEIMKVSESRVSQIHTKAVFELRKYFKEKEASEKKKLETPVVLPRSEHVSSVIPPHLQKKKPIAFPSTITPRTNSSARTRVMAVLKDADTATVLLIQAGSVLALANQIGTNRAYISQLFNEEFGLKPSDILCEFRDARTVEIKELVEQSEDSDGNGGQINSAGLFIPVCLVIHDSLASFDWKIIIDGESGINPDDINEIARQLFCNPNPNDTANRPDGLISGTAILPPPES